MLGWYHFGSKPLAKVRQMLLKAAKLRALKSAFRFSLVEWRRLLGRYQIAPPQTQWLEVGGDQQVRGFAAQCIGNTQDVQYRDVALAALNLAHVRSIDTGGVRQFLLRHREVFTSGANNCAQRRELAVSILLT